MAWRDKEREEGGRRRDKDRGGQREGMGVIKGRGIDKISVNGLERERKRGVGEGKRDKGRGGKRGNGSN